MPSTGPGFGKRAAAVVRSPIAVLALVLLAATVLHFSALERPFFADDYLFLDQARGHSLPSLLASRDPIGNFFRPLGRQAYFWTLARLSGESPRVFHAVNLGLFLAVVGLLFALARRLSGLRAAAIAASLLALHYAADVPVSWASGSQDLLATLGALFALLLAVQGRRIWAAAAFLLALLCKETVLLTPLIALFLVRRSDEPWGRSLRRVWPLLAGAVVWAALYAVMVVRHRAGTGLPGDVSVVPAALVHLIQVMLGAEWRHDDPQRILRTLPPLVPLALALLAVAWAGWPQRRPRRPAGAKKKARAARKRPAPAPARAEPRTGGASEPALQPLRASLVWAAAGALPVAAVANIWSAYFYLFALCGMCLWIGLLAARGPRWGALLLVGLLAWGSQNGRALDEFRSAPDAWSTESHVNRFYLDRAMKTLKRHLADLKRVHPTLPHRSTLFFDGVPVFIAWQVADGPLVRWAYRDSSLRSYFLSNFTLDLAERGPAFFIGFPNDTLSDRTDAPSFYTDAAFGLTLNDKVHTARAVLTLASRRDSTNRQFKYWLAITQCGMGDTAGVARLLSEAGLVPRAGSSPQVELARKRLAAGDSLTAQALARVAITTHALDPEAHAAYADARLGQVMKDGGVVMESYAAVALAPNDPSAWRRWANVQVQFKRYSEAHHSLERYFETGGAVAQGDRWARRMQQMLERAMPGGDLFQRTLRK